MNKVVEAIQTKDTGLRVLDIDSVSVTVDSKLETPTMKEGIIDIYRTELRLGCEFKGNISRDPNAYMHMREKTTKYLLEALYGEVYKALDLIKFYAYNRDYDKIAGKCNELLEHIDP